MILHTQNNVCNLFCSLAQKTELSFSEKHDEFLICASNIEAVSKVF